MKDDMEGIDPQVKECPYCRRTIKKSSHRCPYCRESLAGLEQRRWEETAPSAVPEQIPASEPLPAGKRSGRILVTIFLVCGASIVAFELLRLLGSGITKPEPLLDQSNLHQADPSGREVVHIPRPSPDISSLRKVALAQSVAIPGNSTNTPPSPEKTGSVHGQKELSGPEAEMDEALRAVYTGALQDLREKGAVAAHRVYLKSGREIEGTILEQSGAQIKIQYRGLTTTIAKSTISRIESKTPKELERELQVLALAETEKADRVKVAAATPVKGTVPAQDETQFKPASAESSIQYDSRHFKGKTDRQKMEMLLALLSKEEAKNLAFFGGSLWLDVSDRLRLDTARDDPAPVVFEARARNVDVAQIGDSSRLPLKAAGSCDADLEASLDFHDLTGLTGKALIVGKQIELPPLDLEKLTLPATREAGLVADVAAEDGLLAVRGFRFEGTGYNLSGKGMMRVLDPPERSLIDFSVSVVLKAPPTITDPKLAQSGAEAIIGALVASQAELPLRIVGTLEKPVVQFDSSPSLGAVMK